MAAAAAAPRAAAAATGRAATTAVRHVQREAALHHERAAFDARETGDGGTASGGSGAGAAAMEVETKTGASWSLKSDALQTQVTEVLPASALHHHQQHHHHHYPRSLNRDAEGEFPSIHFSGSAGSL